MWSDCPGQGEHGKELRASEGSERDRETEEGRERRGSTERERERERERWTKKVGPD